MLKYKYVLIFVWLVTYVQRGVCQPPLKWVKEFQSSFGAGGAQEVLDCETDGLGNVYILGNYLDTIDFDPSTKYLKLNAGFDDPFIVKLNSAGQLIWVRQIQCAATDRVRALQLCADTLGNVFVAGRFEGIIDFDPGPGTHTLQANPNTNEGFLIKLDALGNFVFAKDFNGFIEIFDLRISPNQKIYLSGYYQGSVDFDPGVGTSVSYCGNTQNSFVLSMYNDGKFNWARTFASSQNGYSSSLCLDPTGNVYVGGKASLATDFDPGSGIVTNTIISGYVCKLDSLGQFAFVRFFEGGCWVSSIDWSNGLVIAGSFNTSCDLDPGPGLLNMTPSCSNSTEGFFLKLDLGGNLVWQKEINCLSISGISLKIRISDPQSIFLFSCFSGSFDFDPGQGVFSLVSHTVNPQYGLRDLGVVKYDSAGVLIWGFSLGPGGFESIPAAVTPKGEIYSSGVFEIKTDFDPSPSIYTLTPYKGKSIIIEKLSKCDNLDDPQITLYPYRTSICKGETTTLDAYGQPNYYYYWGPGLSNPASMQISPTITTVYEVTAFNPWGCYSTASVAITVIDCTDLPENNFTQDRVFPNPTSEVLHVYLATPCDITLTDENGKIVLSRKTMTRSVDLDLTSVSSGIYYLSKECNGTPFLLEKIVRK